MRTDRTISTSKWTMHHQRTKHNLDVYTIDMVVVGKDLVKMSRNPIFVSRAYQAVFGKDKWKTEHNKMSLKVVKIKLDKNLGESFAKDNDPIMQ